MVAEINQTRNPPKFSVESIRKRAGMFIGNPEDARRHVILELVANSIDAALKHNQLTIIKISYDYPWITVWDSCGCIPFGQEHYFEDLSLIENCVTQYRDNPSFDDHTPHIHLCLRGVGLMVLNALSEELIIESCDGEKTWRQTFGKGKILTQAQCLITPSTQRYSKVSICIDEAVIPKYDLDKAELHQLLFESSHLYPNIQIEFEGKVYYQPKGLIGLASNLVNQSSTPLFYYHKSDINMLLQVVVQGEIKDKGKPTIISWVNGFRTIGHGSHVNGVKKFLKQINWKAEVILVHIIMLQPKYAGPCKDKLVVQEAEDWVYNALLDQFNSQSVP